MRRGALVSHCDLLINCWLFALQSEISFWLWKQHREKLNSSESESHLVMCVCAFTLHSFIKHTHICILQGNCFSQTSYICELALFTLHTNLIWFSNSIFWSFRKWSTYSLIWNHLFRQQPGFHMWVFWISHKNTVRIHKYVNKISKMCMKNLNACFKFDQKTCT